MDPVYRLVNGVGRAALWSMGLDVQWTGGEHLPTEGPVVLASTHASYPDFVFIERAAVSRRRYVRFMTRHDVWNVRAVRPFMDNMQHIPVNREAPVHAYLRARRLLEQGEAVGGFPEAGISFSYTVRPLMRGFLALAQQTGAPVVPLAIWGSQRIFSVGDPELPPDWTRKRRIDLAFGPRLYVAPGDDLTAKTHELGHAMTGLLEGLQQLPHHRPRPGEVATWYPAHLGGQAPTRQRAQGLDVVPFNAVRPSWGPDLDAYDAYDELPPQDRPAR
ncbi:MAG: lysophospholipid acyltransferase family protein [Marmoricola sp.]